MTNRARAPLRIQLANNKTVVIRNGTTKPEIREPEERDRKSYEARPQEDDEVDAWQAEAAWPTE